MKNALGSRVRQQSPRLRLLRANLIAEDRREILESRQQPRGRGEAHRFALDAERTAPLTTGVIVMTTDSLPISAALADRLRDADWPVGAAASFVPFGWEAA